MIFASFGGKLGVEKDVFDGALDINITITLSSFFKLQYVRKFLQESLNWKILKFLKFREAISLKPNNYLEF